MYDQLSGRSSRSILAVSRRCGTRQLCDYTVPARFSGRIPEKMTFLRHTEWGPQNCHLGASPYATLALNRLIPTV